MFEKLAFSRRRGIAVASTLALALTLSACGGDSDSKASSSDGISLKIGAIDNLTGNYGPAGSAEICGVEVAADVVNNGGVEGVTVALDVQDTRSEIASAARIATSMTAEGTNLFVGGTATAFVLASIPMFNGAGALYMAGLTLSPAVVEEGDLPLRINPDNGQSAEQLAIAVEESGAKSVVFVGDQGDYGEGAIAQMREALSKDIEVKQAITVDPTSSAFAPTISRVKAADADAVVFYVGGSVREVAFLREYEKSDVPAQLFAGTAVISLPVVKAAGGAADGVTTVIPYAADMSNDVNATFLEGFEKYASNHKSCEGVGIDFFAENGYSQVLLLAEAAKAAGSNDPKEIRDTAIDGTWDLPRGSVTFQNTGQIDAELIVAVGDGSSGLVQKD